jgi:hypothetical protein
MNVAPDKDKCRAVVGTVMNIWVPQNVGSFLSAEGTAPFSKRALLHGIVELLLHDFNLLQNITQLIRAIRIGESVHVTTIGERIEIWYCPNLIEFGLRYLALSSDDRSLVLGVSATVSLLHRAATHCQLLAPCAMRTNRSRHGVTPQHEGQSANGCCSWPTLQSATHRHVCPGLLVRSCDNPCNARYGRGDERGTETGGVSGERGREGRKEGRKERTNDYKE